MEFDKRQLHLSLGYSGLFPYLVKVHNFSESSAYRYTQVVKVAKVFPTVIDDLKEGRISLSYLAKVSKQLLASDFTFTEKVEMLDRLKGVTKKEVERIIAPKVKELPKERVQTLVFEEQPEKNPPPQKKRQAKVFMKTLTFTVKESTYKKLERAKEVLSTKYPKGALTSEVFEEALELLLEKKCPQRKEQRIKKRAVKEPIKKAAKKTISQRKALPAKVKREVLKRDNHRCSYVSTDGKVCGSTHNLHFDHVKPLALGGGDGLSNIRLLCGKHNLFEAKRVLGERFILNKIKDGSELPG